MAQFPLGAMLGRFQLRVIGMSENRPKKMEKKTSDTINKIIPKRIPL